MAAVTIDEAVKSAVEQNTETQPPTTEEIKVEETKTTQVEPQVQDEKTRRALALYDLLDNAETAPAIIETIAKRAGMAVQRGQVTQTEARKASLDVLKEALGAEYEFLAERLDKGLSTLINDAVNERVKPIQDSSRAALEKAIDRETDAEMEKFYAKHKDAKELDKELTALAKRMPFIAEPNYTLSDYLADLYKIVTYDKKEAQTVEKTVGRINKNAKEVRETSVEAIESSTKRGSKLPTLDEALKAGARGEKLF